MIKKKICIISSSRADLGIMKSDQENAKNKKYKNSLILTGGHLSKNLEILKKKL